MANLSSEVIPFDEFLNSQVAGVWREATFDVNAAIYSTSLILELGGPTPHGYQMIGKKAIKGAIISNKNVMNGINVVADARQLPFSADTFGAVLTSAFPDHLLVNEDGEEVGYRAQMLTEGVRVLSEGGIFVLQHGNIRDADGLTKLGLNPVMAKINKAKHPRRRLTSLDDNVEWSHTKSLFIYKK
jgi:hypothetical protein